MKVKELLGTTSAPEGLRRLGEIERTAARIDFDQEVEGGFPLNEDDVVIGWDDFQWLLRQAEHVQTDRAHMHCPYRED